MTDLCVAHVVKNLLVIACQNIYIQVGCQSLWVEGKIVKIEWTFSEAIDFVAVCCNRLLSRVTSIYGRNVKKDKSK
jgi:hypothetical protein